MSLRTRPLSDSIVRDTRLGNVRIVTVEPGNSTRYELFITDLRGLQLPPGTHGLPAEGGWMVLYDDRNMAIPVFTGTLHWTWVKGKLGLGSVSDAVVLAEALGYLLNISAVSCEEYQRDNG